MTDVVHIDFADKQPGLPELGKEVACERVDCGVPNNLFVQYGLLGGGCGVYSICETCDKLVGKTIDQEGMEEDSDD